MRTIASEKETPRVCGTCKWAEYDEQSDGDYVCVCYESPNNADWVEYDESCEEWCER